jgi:hypothetical protein
MRKIVTTRARVSARRAPLQPLKDGARRQQRDNLAYGTIGEPIGEGLWVVNCDGMPPKHESAHALRVEPDNYGRFTANTTKFRSAQRVEV